MTRILTLVVAALATVILVSAGPAAAAGIDPTIANAVTCWIVHG